MVFVLASWGEVVTMEPLVRALRRERPGARIVISVERREAIAAARALSDEAVVPFPFDSALPVARWHARAAPDLVVLFEQFDFPTFTRSLWTQRVPFIVLQARIKPGRGVGYQRRLANPKFKRWQLRGLRAMLVASPPQREQIAPIMPAEAQLQSVGSLKFPHHEPRISARKTADLRAWIDAATAGAPLLIAGSTHAREEAFVWDALQIARGGREQNAPVLLIAPRRLHRVDEVVELLNQSGARIARRSRWKAGENIGAVDVLLLDTLGELGAAYQFATGAFVGGTINGASHNVAEPLVWGVPTSYGPTRGNFAVEQILCEEAGVGFRIETPAQLADHWVSLLQSSELRAQLSDKAQTLVEAQSGAFAQTLQTLLEAADAIALR